RCARTDTGAARRVAEVARAVEPPIDTAASARKALQHVVDGVEAVLLDVLLVDEDARSVLIKCIVPDARSGDHDLGGGSPCSRLGRSRGSLGPGDAASGTQGNECHTCAKD